ncbi:hypothetical protein EDD29_6317 [Actinocorallia herbida]|uniref:Uncharacterized protein n=1 Tax=Actinocorallia herbida TaxID=58109 RepID=A0A3N1D520_9ACTN|nr:hypothetical protein [Actinocorallia herbida]ROO88643.1 hypothetical protein EDD29_6317 [Actinocorallia herbida]
MRISRAIGPFAAAMFALGLLSTVYAVADRPPPALRFDPDGCPHRPFEKEFQGRSGTGPWPLSELPAHRDLAPDGAVSAVLCDRAYDASEWPEPMRLTRLVGELEQVLDGLPITRPGGPSTLVGFSDLNLVLHYPDGTAMPMSFEFNRDEVTSRVAVRGGAALLTEEFARLWSAENASPHPERITPVACPRRAPDTRAIWFLPADQAIPKGIDFFRRAPDGPLLPVELAVVKACRYTADDRGRLVLRDSAETRTGLAPLRAAVNAPPRPGAPKCRKKTTAMDVLMLTDVTGRALPLRLGLAPCENELAGRRTGTWPITPEIRAFTTRLLG